MERKSVTEDSARADKLGRMISRVISVGLGVVMVLGLGYLAGRMADGEVVIGGQSDTEASKPIAERSEADDQTPFTVRVRTFLAQERTPNLTIRGRTEADAKLSVRAETTGILQDRRFREGDRVVAGQDLCILDAQTREADVIKARAALDQAIFDYEANRKLHEKGHTTETRLNSLKASLDSARASFAAAELELDRSIVRAPVSGIVEDPIAKEGDLLQVGGVCATITDSDPMLITGQVSERDIAKLDVGMAAEAILVTGENVAGAISYIAPSADESTRTFRVEISVPNENFTIRDGVTAEAKIALAPQTGHFISPGVLTLSDDGEIGVRTIVDGNKVAFMPVAILSDTGKGYWVAGLPSEVKIIVVGQDYVKAGETVAVEIISAEAAQ